MSNNVESHSNGPPPRPKDMLAALFGETSIERAHSKGRTELEAAAERLRVAILDADPRALLGYLWAQILMGRLAIVGDSADTSMESDSSDDETVVLALEYVHAVLAGHVENPAASTKEQALHAVLSAAEALRDVSLRYCLVAAGAMPDTIDEETRTLAMQAMSSWVMLRGHRYQSLEQEFFEFVLAPHEDALVQAYGIGAAEIARGIQASVDTMRYGHMKAFNTLSEEMNRTHAAAEVEEIALEEAIEKLYAAEGARDNARSAIDELFFGGICNVGKTSNLPLSLLDDMAFSRGQENEFFAPGNLRGTPLRRLPARERPLIRLGSDYYACDPNFLRDSAYRAIQWGLGRRIENYERTLWSKRQTEVTEGAFQTILSNQLRGAIILDSVYYPDPDTGKWVENDVVVLLDDVLIQVEAKAGVMPMHSPEMHFDKHMRTVESLVVKAKQQCERFFRYANSAPEVPLYRLVAGQHVEVHRLRLSSYRLAIPIGLTIEAFTPFSAMSKRLPQMSPILGKHSFVSMSVDDLFVLSRLLLTSGELMHYLLVRQRIAEQADATLVDELDHLGAYVTHNRVDMYNENNFAEGVAMVNHAGASKTVDDYFGIPNFETHSPPSQVFPALLAKFLASNETVRGPGFLRADVLIRDFDTATRSRLEEFLGTLVPTLREHPYRWALLGGNDSTLIWLQRVGYIDKEGVMRAKAEAALLGLGQRRCDVVVMYVNHVGDFAGGTAYEITAPSRFHPSYLKRMEEGKRMMGRSIPLR